MESLLTKVMGAGEWKEPPVERFYRKKKHTMHIVFVFANFQNNFHGPGGPNKIFHDSKN